MKEIAALRVLLKMADDQLLDLTIQIEKMQDTLLQLGGIALTDAWYERETTVDEF
jgi:hypothetical protein